MSSVKLEMDDLSRGLIQAALKAPSAFLYSAGFSSLLGDMQPSNHNYYMYQQQQQQGPSSVGAAPPLHTPTPEGCPSQGGKQQGGEGYGPPPVMSMHPPPMQHGGYHQHQQHHPHSHPQQQPHQHQQQQQSQASINNAGFGESGAMEGTAGEKGAVRSPRTEIPQGSFPEVVPTLCVEKGRKPVVVET